MQEILINKILYYKCASDLEKYITPPLNKLKDENL